MSNATAYPAAVAALAAQIPNTVTISSEARAYYDGSITAADAMTAGADIESVTVLDEILRVGALCISAVIAGKVSGYGKIRMKYMLDLAALLAGKVAELDTSRVSATGAGTAKVMTLRESRDLRTKAVRVLKNLAGRREEEKARLDKARKGKEKADERARSLDALADELKKVIATVPAEVAEDAGATQELVGALQEAAGAVLGSRGDAQHTRTAVASLYDEMNVLDGRLLHELRQLIGAMRDARKVDKTVPAVKSPLFTSGKKKPGPGKGPG